MILIMSAQNREKFVEQVIEEVHVKFPLVKLARADAHFSLSINGVVASLENLYRMTAMRPEELKHNVDRWIVELLRATEGTPDETGTFEELKDRIFPMVLGNANADVAGAQMVTQQFVSGLTIAYAVDHDRTISYIPSRVFKSWKISLDDLHERALENLIAKSDSMAAHAAQDEEGNVNLILFQTMDGYDASRILLPNLHEKLRGYLGSPFMAGIPNRDILICFRNEAEITNRLKEQIANDYNQMPHQVTEKLLLVTADGVAPFEDE